jgi:hypothetical protein
MASESMTPEEEAEHALANGTPRRQLSDEAKKIWDRLRAERDPGYQPYMRDVDDVYEREASLAQLQAADRKALKDARQAIADGRKLFLVRVPMMYDQLIAVGTAGLPGPSSVIESIENLGWRLDQMSWVSRPGSKTRAEGIFLFRRAV